MFAHEKRFEQKLQIDQIAITDAYFNFKCTHVLDELLCALKNLFCNPDYNEQLFEILESHLCACRLNNGSPGMELWQIFVLAQLRL